MVVRLRISGRVQGVFYRGWLTDQAKASGVDGWVRNRDNGTVEAVLSGEPDAVRELIRDCHEGPSQARVDTIEEYPEPNEPEPGFRQRPTL